MMNQQFFCDKKVDSQQHEVRQIISDTAFCRKYVKLLTLYNKMCYNKNNFQTYKLYSNFPKDEIALFLSPELLNYYQGE